MKALSAVNAMASLPRAERPISITPIFVKP